MAKMLAVGCVLMGAASCGEDSATDDNTNPPSGTVTGTLSGLSIAEGSTVAVAWVVSSGSPDYTYKAGEGTIVGNQFGIDLPQDLPDAAVNSYGVGVGYIVVLPPGVDWADGQLADDSADSVAGWVTDKAVIWRESNAQDLDWSGDFPVGYGCGSCVPASGGATFDTFDPVDCSGLEVNVSANDDVCNWT